MLDENKMFKDIESDLLKLVGSYPEDNCTSTTITVTSVGKDGRIYYSMNYIQDGEVAMIQTSIHASVLQLMLYKKELA